MSYKPFINALLWNTLNIFLYKIILQTHQTCLFYAVSKELFGICGTLFSTIYLLINLTNFGFDYSLFAFHRSYTSCKSHFKKTMYQFARRCLIVLATTTTLLVFLYYFQNSPKISFLAKFLSPHLVLFLTIIFISENMKKSFELFAHLSFLNKTITIIEIATLLSYVTIVWSSYLIRGYIDMAAIFIPMCITSIIELSIVIKRIFSFYQNLPEHSSLPYPTTQIILKNQSVNYINQITKALFSPNFIIIFLAYHLGMVKAGYIKLIIDIVILLYMLLNRAVGIPSGALMSQGTDTSESETSSNFPHFKSSFLKITNGYIQFLYGLIITSCFAIIPCLIKSNCLDPILTTNILLFTFAGFLEYLIITYEKLYLTQNASSQLASINLSSLLLLAPMLWYSAWFHQAYLLIPFILIRLCSASLIAFFAYRIWTVVPTFQIKLKTILIATIPSTALVIWHIKS